MQMLNEPSIDHVELIDIEPTTPTWMDSIKDYLNGKILERKAEARKLGRRAADYVIQQRKLYKRGFSLPLLRCLDSDEADYVIREVHDEVYRNHSGARSMVLKIIRQGY